MQQLDVLPLVLAAYVVGASSRSAFNDAPNRGCVIS